MNQSFSLEQIKDKIYQIRGKNVMLDRDIAVLYAVDTKQLTRQVRRNIKRFPSDFMFQLTKKELVNLRCQFGTSSWGGRRYLPYVFTEQGIAMLSGVLSSERAIGVNIQIMRAFVALRRWSISHENLRRKIDTMEKKYDGQFQIVFRALKKLMETPPKKKNPPIGFHRD